MDKLHYTYLQPTYSLAKYLNRILLPLTTNEFTVKIFFDFAEEVINYDHNLYMASLDGELLFTNILWQKLLRTVSATYSLIMFIVVN